MFNRRRPHGYHRQRIRERGSLAVAICCIPCICVVGSCALISYTFSKIMEYERPSTKRKRELEREEREMRRRTPWVLGPRLEGALTIGREDEDFGEATMPGLGSKIVKDDEDGESESKISSESEELVKGKLKRKTDWQSQSAFFKLPLETRRQIYEEAIGCYFIHIWSLDEYRRMSHTRSKTPCPRDCTCESHSKRPGVADEWGNISLLSLLSTCRRMYSESIEILYSKNTFTFDSFNPLINHLLKIPTHRIPQMRNVQWRIFAPFMQWNETSPGLEWNTAAPWLECRKETESVKGEERGAVEREVHEIGAGCVCWWCCPKRVLMDRHAHAWLQYCWLMRTVEDKKGLNR